jgi:hypothetical protein
MSLFDELPEPVKPLPYLPMDGAEAIQMRLLIVESTFETAAHICRAVEVAVNHGEYRFTSACKAYDTIFGQLDTAIKELKAITQHKE